jgi:alpha-D-ribose 1-methylphosphonate 5-triphosphate synthase subunit PhnH
MDQTRTILEHEAFRNILQAFARPGTAHGIASSVSDRISALDLLADCLLDSECALSHLREEDAAIADRLSQRTGCRLRPVTEAEFVLTGTAGISDRLGELRSGDPDYPDRGSTLLYLVEEILAEGGSWWWSGPGIRTRIAPRIVGIQNAEWELLSLANSSYPLGMDAIFLDRDGKVAALPRSTRLEEVR